MTPEYLGQLILADMCEEAALVRYLCSPPPMWHGGGDPTPVEQDVAAALPGATSPTPPIYTTTRRRRRGGSGLPSSLRVDVGEVVVFGAVVLVTAWFCIDLIRQGINNGYFR